VRHAGRRSLPRRCVRPIPTAPLECAGSKGRRDEQAKSDHRLACLYGRDDDCEADAEGESEGSRPREKGGLAATQLRGDPGRGRCRDRSALVLAQPQLFERLHTELTRETIVVGGGLAGLTVARYAAECGDKVVLVERGGIGAGASGRNGGFLFRQPAAWINEHLEESAAIYAELQEHGPVPFDFGPRPQLVLAVEEDELSHARAYAESVGGEEVDLREDPWFADDLAGGFVVEGGFVLDAMGATTAMAEAARHAGVELSLGCEAKRILVDMGRVSGLATDAGILRCDRIVVASGPRARFLLRTAGIDLPISSSRGWLMETAPVDQPPPYSIEQAVWPVQEDIGMLVAEPTLAQVAAGKAEEPTLVSLLLGGRSAGQCVIGTSLGRSLTEEAEGPDTVRRLAERAARVSPQLRDVPVVAAWSGRRAMSPDGLPVVGPVPGLDGLEVASGFSSIGMMTIPAACKRLVEGSPTPEHAPGRFA
jgi:D-hydroxyproline dehydrogenase subunit beta